MDCSVPVVSSPAAPAITASGGSGLAVTGSPLDVVVACTIAVVLLASGAIVLTRARRRRRNALPHRAVSAPGAGIALLSVLGVVLLLGAVSPVQASHAAAPEQCDAISVSDVQIDASVLVDGVIQLLPGGQPAVVRASVANSTTVPMVVTAIARTDGSVAVAKEIVWRSESSIGSPVESTLGDSDTHSLGVLAPGQSTTATFTVNLPASVGNEYQGQVIPLDLRVRAVQQGF